MRWTRVLLAPFRGWLPSLVIVVAWLAIWGLWPTPEVTTKRAVRQRQPHVVYTQSDTSLPTLFNQPDKFINPTTPIGEDLEGHELPDMLASRRMRGFQFLGQTEPPAYMKGARPSTRSAPPPYNPVWSDTPLFLLGSAGMMRVAAIPSGPLAAQQFRIGDFTTADPKILAKQWTIVAYVEVGEGGWPRHVYLEEPSDDPGLNRTVLRLIYEGRVARPGTPCEGRLTVSCEPSPGTTL